MERTYLSDVEDLANIVDFNLGRLLFGQHPQQLGRGPMFRGQQCRCADDVLQELDGQILQVGIILKVLRYKTQLMST